MKTYYAGAGFFNDGLVFVTWDEKVVAPLKLRLDLRNHSPTGFGWGYAGSGPAQLALAILADCVGDERALANYMAFKFRVIALLPQEEGFELDEADIIKTVEDIERARAAERAKAAQEG
jgi:Family of unknown function (DUF6166)